MYNNLYKSTKLPYQLFRRMGLHEKKNIFKSNRFNSEFRVNSHLETERKLIKNK